jgi:hypothetical protein
LAAKPFHFYAAHRPVSVFAQRTGSERFPPVRTLGSGDFHGYLKFHCLLTMPYTGFHVTVFGGLAGEGRVE